MIPPHSTVQEQAEYAQKLADVFERHFAKTPRVEDEFPWGDVLPLRAIATTLRNFSSVSSTIQNTMPKYRITVTELFADPTTVADGVQVAEVYSQTIENLNLSVLIKALNPTTRKRRAKKEAA